MSNIGDNYSFAQVRCVEKYPVTVDKLWIFGINPAHLANL